MGINYLDACMLFEAAQCGASFAKTLTVAHLSLKLLPSEVEALRERYRARYPEAATVPLQRYSPGGFSDELFSEMLGASSLSVMDYSSYEGATVIHDLNRPVPDNLVGRFDAVIDGGSLEHVFNFPVAITNLMRMLKTGGYMFIKSPANNLCGHGFYQFSPELMFRVFSKQNGFEVTRIVFVESDFPSVELTPYRAAYEVADPQVVGSRVGLVSKGPVVMVVEARKTADVPLFAEPPLQSDYVTDWSRSRASSTSSGFFAKTGRAVFSRLPSFVRARIAGHRELRRFSFSNPRFYRRIGR